MQYTYIHNSTYMYEYIDMYVQRYIHIRWTRRATLIGERIASRVDGSFEVPASMKVHRFSKLFPDQHQHLRAWAKHFKQKDLKKVFKRLKYTGSAEYFSMYSCLLMDPRIRSLDHKTLKSQKVIKRIKVLRKSMRHPVHGYEAHPATVILAAMETR